MISGIICALLTTMSWSIGIFPFTEASKRVNPKVVNPLRLTFACIILSLVLASSSGLNLITDCANLGFWLFAVSGIVGFTIGDGFSFSSFVHLGPRLGSLFTSLAPVSAAWCSWIFLNEILKWESYLGMFLIVIAVTWLSFSKSDARQSEAYGFKRNTKGIVYGILGAFCQGFGLVLSKWAFKELPVHALEAVWIRLLFASISSWIVLGLNSHLLPQVKYVFLNRQRTLTYIVWGTLFGPLIGVSLSLYTIQILPAALAQSIFALLPLLTLPINRWMYKEPITLSALLASALAILGAILLIVTV